MDRCRCCNLLHNGVAEYLCLSIHLIITHGAPTLFPLLRPQLYAQPSPARSPVPKSSRTLQLLKIAKLRLADRMCRDNPAAVAALRTGSAGELLCSVLVRLELNLNMNGWSTGPGQGTAWSPLQWRRNTALLLLLGSDSGAPPPAAQADQLWAGVKLHRSAAVHRAASPWVLAGAAPVPTYSAAASNCRAVGHIFGNSGKHFPASLVTDDLIRNSKQTPSCQHLHFSWTPPGSWLVEST